MNTFKLRENFTQFKTVDKPQFCVRQNWGLSTA